jgi:stage II sporulation protein D
MKPPPFSHPNALNRREFVIATGIFLASGNVSCGRTENALPRPPVKPTHDVTANPIDIRVRIGSKINKVLINNNVFTKKDIVNGQKNIELSPSSTVTTDDQTKKITGSITLHTREDNPNTFDVVAHVPIEQYLPGVLAGELFAHWHIDTFIAQAVAARSYATAQHLDRIGKSHFDVDDGPSSQMFLGDVTLDVAHRAVDESSSIVLSWEGSIIPAYYCACCGGTPATASDAISGASTHDIPPLRGHGSNDICQSLDVHKWSVTRSSRIVRRRINACANRMSVPEFSSIRTIRSIEPTVVNSHGRPVQLAIYDRRNTPIEVRARDLVRAVNATIPSLPSPTPMIWSSNLNAKKVDNMVQFEGTGMGHGVGLCQYGAQERAGRGESWEDILAWYYPSVTIS